MCRGSGGVAPIRARIVLVHGDLPRPCGLAALDRDLHYNVAVLRRHPIAFTEWCTSRGTEARFIQPGKLDQNALIERFNKTYRDEVLDAYVFETVEQVREITETWLHEYNEERPQDSLGRVPPLRFMPRPLAARESSFKLCP